MTSQKPTLRKSPFWQALAQHTKYEGNWMLRWYERIYYTAKAIAALLLNRETRLTWEDDTITVAYLDGGTSYIPGQPTLHWFVALYVPKGRFGYEIRHDSD